MRYLIVRTEVRTVASDELANAWSDSRWVRDEREHPEPRRLTATADDLPAALILARALTATGLVRSGRCRVKILPFGPREHSTGDGRHRSPFTAGIAAPPPRGAP
ncbi:hypothetical protein [Rhizomonospora bruguierae]|uniref:hypothetical protein n=1 Tax=Rhizomonospora bruguierae TaxID=1581705 RepID=UPI0020C0AC53|nr:hypothetical protein [Micromonospora sp. NBRC 107566]